MHRDGLMVQNFLFDLVNDVMGFTSKYYRENTSAERLSCEELTKVGVEQRGRPRGFDSVLVLEGAHFLYKMSGPD